MLFRSQKILFTIEPTDDFSFIVTNTNSHEAQTYTATKLLQTPSILAALSSKNIEQIITATLKLSITQTKHLKIIKTKLSTTAQKSYVIYNNNDNSTTELTLESLITSPELIKNLTNSDILSTSFDYGVELARKKKLLEKERTQC